MATVKIISGGSRVSPERGFGDEATVRDALVVLESCGINTIDTARVYGQSEMLLGRFGASSRFLIDPKIPGGMKPGSLSAQQIKESLEESLQELQADKINVLYFHAPDKSAPIEDSLACINELHTAGLFAHFGLSNFLPGEVEEVHRHCETHGYVLPTVYQGKYNPFARRQDHLFPTLRRLGISFYAYNPIAGGLLAKSRAQVWNGSGRFIPGSLYWKLYINDARLDSLASWEDIASDAQCSPAELAYRWTTFSSFLKPELGDGVVVGSNGIDQLKQTLVWLRKGPLTGQTCKAIDDLWKAIKYDAPLDVFHG